MTRYGFLFSFFLLLGVPAAIARPLLIKNAQIIDLTAGSVKGKQDILIDKDRILEVGEGLKKADAEVIDAQGAFLMPALWDMHVHVKPHIAHYFLPAGVLYVRDMFKSPFYKTVKQGLDSGAYQGPSIMQTGQLIDGEPGMWGAGAPTASSPEAVRKLIDETAKDPDMAFVKFYDLMKPDVYFAGAEALKKKNMTLLGHVPYLIRAEDAIVKAGQKTIEHMTGLALAASPLGDSIQENWLKTNATANAQTILKAYDDALPKLNASFDEKRVRKLARQMKERNAWLVPTLINQWGWEGAVEHGPEVLEQRRLMPKDLLTWWNDRQKEEDKIPEVARQKLLNEQRMVKLMFDEGVGIMAGTDTPNPWVMPGYGLHAELKLLHQSGLTRIDALRSATLQPARFLGLTERFGQIKPGFDAGLVLLPGNPLDDLVYLGKIKGIVWKGRFVDQAELDRIARSGQVIKDGPR